MTTINNNKCILWPISIKKCSPKNSTAKKHATYFITNERFSSTGQVSFQTKHSAPTITKCSITMHLSWRNCCWTSSEGATQCWSTGRMRMGRRREIGCTVCIVKQMPSGAVIYFTKCVSDIECVILIWIKKLNIVKQS